MSYDLGFLLKGLSTKLTASYDTQSINYLVGKKGYQYWESVVDPNRKNPDGSDYIEYHRIRTDFDNTPSFYQQVGYICFFLRLTMAD